MMRNVYIISHLVCFDNQSRLNIPLYTLSATFFIRIRTIFYAVSIKRHGSYRNCKKWLVDFIYIHTQCKMICSHPRRTGFMQVCLVLIKYTMRLQKLSNISLKPQSMRHLRSLFFRIVLLFLFLFVWCLLSLKNKVCDLILYTFPISAFQSWFLYYGFHTRCFPRACQCVDISL